MKKITFPFALTLSFFFATFMLLGCSDPNAPKSREERIQSMIENINNTPEWIGGLKHDAEIKRKPLDSLVLEAATFMIDKEDAKSVPREARIEKVKKNMHETPEWLALLTKKAADAKMPLDSMMQHEASWMIDEEDGKHAQVAPAPAAPAPTK
jgi:PBP1b-binding outer membrane lipoprotein LpoB